MRRVEFMGDNNASRPKQSECRRSQSWKGRARGVRDESQEFAEIADGQVAAHLLRFRADHIHAREGAVTQPGGLPVLPRTDRVSMNTERPANALCEAKKRSSRSKFGGLPSAVAARSVPAGLRAHILGWDGEERRDT